ncbi:MAG: hypothetical protein RR133_04320 [Kiritimatiellia bacterium]
MQLTPQQADWLFTLQRPWPLTERPLLQLAQTLHTDEASLVEFISSLRSEGLVRRIGGVFDSRRLGYRSCLFAVSAEGDALEAAAREVSAHSGVTHAYIRSWPEGIQLGNLSASDYAPYPKLWYTLSVRGDHFEMESAKLAHLSPRPFPALTRYKIDVVFDTRTCPRDERTEYIMPALPQPLPLPTAEQRTRVRAYQEDTADIMHPFRTEDLAQLQAWQENGTLRRFALLLRHRASGFTANGMCCWSVPQTALEAAGRRLAQASDVTHCYARPSFPEFPFNLYAMIHKTSWQEGYETFLRLTRDAELPANGKVFFSTREFKKTSVRFFCEED